MNGEERAESEGQMNAERQAEQNGLTDRSRRWKMVIQYCKRYFILLVGLCIMSVGVALSIKADLGTSPISSVPYVLNLITELSVGTTTIVVNVLMVLLQILILRKRYHPIQLLQIPACVVFGLLTDVAMLLVEGVVLDAYWQQCLVCLAGILLVAVAVSFEVSAHAVTLPGEGLALAVHQVTRIKFGYTKVMCDVSLVIIATALSLIFLHGLHGVREGTLAAAIFVGLLAKQINRVLVPLIGRWVEGPAFERGE